ncbi:quinohemoprotein ethanol dehydrogenase [Altererythrobacter atlanticus]|uniref:Quinohemoprotein alcohol dehydrogenase ADH IIB n=1 Tax=Croceibacterium atlanticum TaxID=1267766 RepID=A0A0F7KYN7_9SPHN|nr:PQQ-dependent dehydrogenase, methanol/ethanol family [Croceibacterium atlanticum]AKH43915.1 Quinohemoprotein alcohol dehydrogenase ADH IIB precursor [Croceibacterium atlanticum]MBB5733635.1 quinohemoprotein ethanol dehydrogenase [Croceibacterium atlanticum]
MRKLLVVAAAALALSACSGGRDKPDIDISVYGAGDDWNNPGGDWAESYFSRLTDIDAANVGRLGLAWEYDLGTARVQEATPVVIDGIMYTSGNLGRVYALDAATGEELWTFVPDIDMQANRAACCDQANRGVAVQHGHDGNTVFVGALDGWLYALDGASGAVLWKVDTINDRSRGYTITGAPELAGDLVIIGNAGAEYDVRGYVTAYDTSSGEEVWRFFTIPHDPAEGPQESLALEDALETWDPESRWDIGGGGTVWDAITYDPVYDQVIIGVGNGGPYPLAIRSPEGGDNLYLNSLVALDRETGEMKWHFQETPTDSWDLTATQPMILADMEVGGNQRKVILHSPKNGFYFVVDRETGKPLVAQQMVRTSWASGWDLETGKPKLTPEYSDYSTGPKIVFPASSGARNWHPASYDPTRGLYFASFVDMGNLMFIPPGQENPPHKPKALNADAALIFTADLQQALATLPPPMQEAVKALPQWQQVQDMPFSSQLRAVDAATGEVKWTAEHDGWQDRAGVLSTASGLVFHGDIAGRLKVFDAETGKLLKTIETGTSILAAPMTYRVDGVQYVAVQAGWGGGGWGFVPGYAVAYKKGNQNRLLVFKLDGGEVPIPDDLPPLQPAPQPPEQFADATPEMIATGSALFTENCSMCHSNQPRAPLPDLRRMSEGVHGAFDQIVLEGLLLPNGMPRWDDILDPEQARAIHAFLIDEQKKLRTRELELQRQGKPLDSRSLTILSNF